eukprot:g83097.t1
MWTAAWQEKYLRQNVCKRNFQLDSTGQVNQYGYTLYSLIMVSESCKKGVPIAHMVIGRMEAQVITVFLNFVRSIVPDWTPSFMIIDKSITEAKGIKLFAEANRENNIWRRAWQRCYIPRNIRDFIYFTNNYLESWHNVLKSLFGKDVFEIILGGEYQAGPTCSCDDPDPRICLHIKIVHYHPEVFYENDQ